MEVEVAAKFGVRLVIFHYRDAADRNRLGQLLRAYDGTSVQFETPGGPWRAATVLRLKSCFGRGLLVFAISEPALARGDNFFIRFSSHGERRATGPVGRVKAKRELEKPRAVSHLFTLSP
jgi:hypothetical protein